MEAEKDFSAEVMSADLKELAVDVELVDETPEVESGDVELVDDTPEVEPSVNTEICQDLGRIACAGCPLFKLCKPEAEVDFIPFEPEEATFEVSIEDILKEEAPKIEAPKIETLKLKTPKIEVPEIKTSKTEALEIKTPEIKAPKVEVVDEAVEIVKQVVEVKNKETPKDEELSRDEGVLKEEEVSKDAHQTTVETQNKVEYDNAKVVVEPMHISKPELATPDPVARPTFRELLLDDSVEAITTKGYTKVPNPVKRSVEQQFQEPIVELDDKVTRKATTTEAPIVEQLPVEPIKHLAISQAPEQVKRPAAWQTPKSIKHKHAVTQHQTPRRIKHPIIQQQIFEPIKHPVVQKNIEQIKQPLVQEAPVQIKEFSIKQAVDRIIKPKINQPEKPTIIDTPAKLSTEKLVTQEIVKIPTVELEMIDASVKPETQPITDEINLPVPPVESIESATLYKPPQIELTIDREGERQEESTMSLIDNLIKVHTEEPEEVSSVRYELKRDAVVILEKVRDEEEEDYAQMDERPLASSDIPQLNWMSNNFTQCILGAISIGLYNNIYGQIRNQS